VDAGTIQEGTMTRTADDYKCTRCKRYLNSEGHCMDCGRYQATGDYRVTGLALALARIEAVAKQREPASGD
jgi:hypothetical protein